MTYQDVLKLNIPEQFGLNEDDDWGGDLDFVVDQFKEEDIRYDNGCSKFVIFLNDDEVVKIPFNGYHYYNDEDEEEGFCEFNNSDYCDIEAEIYQDAVVAGLSHFFAKTVFAGFTEKTHYPIYLSERVIPFEDKDYESIKPSEDSVNKANNMITSISSRWLACAIDYYGQEEVSRLVDFIREERVGDFHAGNVGFRKDGAPVLLDYSGYNENSGF